MKVLCNFPKFNDPKNCGKHTTSFYTMHGQIQSHKTVPLNPQICGFAICCTYLRTVHLRIMRYVEPRRSEFNASEHILLTQRYRESSLSVINNTRPRLPAWNDCAESIKKIVKNTINSNRKWNIFLLRFRGLPWLKIERKPSCLSWSYTVNKVGFPVPRKDVTNQTPWLGII